RIPALRHRSIHPVVQFLQPPAQKRLPRDSRQHRTPQLPQLVLMRQQRIILPQPLPKPISRINRNPAFLDPRRQSTSLFSSRGNSRHSLGRPRVCIRTTPHPSCAQVPAIVSSQPSALTSFTISTPASTAVCAVADLSVSTESSASGF